ncbi:3-oxoacyl-ACP synthase III family protein [Candidatus Neomarinimicrobiota bacterium]
MTNTYIAGTGFHVPERIVTNKDLESMMDTSDEWIRTRTGIEERHFAAEGEGPSDLAIPATTQALEEAGLGVEDIDFIIFATSTPDFYAPGSGVLLQHKMGFRQIGALDVRVQCSGFIYGLSIADQYIKTGTFRNILLIGAEVQSTVINLTDEGRDVSVIFGDGAGAVVLQGTDEQRGILSTHMHSQGEHAEELFVRLPASTQVPSITAKDVDAGRHHPYMNGREVFKNAVVRFPEVIKEALEANQLTVDDLALVIPHQANIRITKEVSRRMGISEKLVYSNIHKYGNTTAASVPIALAEARREGRIAGGDNIVMAAFGSGFTWASALVKW